MNMKKNCLVLAKPFLLSFILFLPLLYANHYGRTYGLFWADSVCYYALTYFCLCYYSQKLTISNWFITLAICLGIALYVDVSSWTLLLCTFSLRLLTMVCIVLATLCFQIRKYWIFGLSLLVILLLNTVVASFFNDIWSVIFSQGVQISFE